MKNYTYGWKLKEQGFVEIPVAEYTNEQWEMSQFIHGAINNAIRCANCGWGGVRYKVLSLHNIQREYMILYSTGDCNNNYSNSRWIPVDGNSKGCNFTVLGENLW